MVGKHGCHQKIFSVIVLLCTGWLYAKNDIQSVSHYDKEIHKSNNQLDKIKTEIEKGRNKLKQLQQKEGSYLDQLEQIEKNIAASQEYLAVLDQRIDTVEQILSSLDDSLGYAEKQLSERNAIMRKRLRQAYMKKRPPILVTIFTAKNPLDAINKVKYVEKVNKYDRELVKQISIGKQDIDTRKKTKTLELEHYASLKEAKAIENTALKEQEKQRKHMLEGIRKEKTVYEKMVQELEKSQKELVAMIQRLEKKKKNAKEVHTRKNVISFGKKKGTLPWPVKGSIVTQFGKVVHPEYNTVIMNNGIDIKAQKGEPVYCVAEGRVIHTGWLRGLGKMVIVDHDEGYLSIYAHLKNIDVTTDEEVGDDSILGKVGDTGSLSGVRMHFEIRKSSDALDPVLWLEKR